VQINGRKVVKTKKAGKLANGFEIGKGSIIHLNYSGNEYVSLCGEKAAITFVETDRDVTCKKCLRAVEDDNPDISDFDALNAILRNKT
jgi:hypothetical protein